MPPPAPCPLNPTPGIAPRSPLSARAGRLWSLYQELDRSQWGTPAELERLQLAHLRLLLKHCVRHVPAYCQRLFAAGLAPEAIRTPEDFRRLPLLARRTYREQVAAFRARVLPPGTTPAGRGPTSGTAGEPGAVWQTNQTNLRWWALYLRDRDWAGLSASSHQAIGELLADAGDLRIEAAFGVPARDVYACPEAGFLASPCPQGHGLHVHAEHVLLEVLDEHDRPCLPGQAGRVVLTTLHNSLTPLVRYETLDEAIPGPTACPCGRGLPLLAKVWSKRPPAAADRESAVEAVGADRATEAAPSAHTAGPGGSRRGGERPILFGWELGAGLGHLQRLLPLARALASHGYRPVFAVKDPGAAAPVLRDTCYPVLPAPVGGTRLLPPDRSFLAASYADVLAVQGFAAVEEVLPTVDAWQALIDRVQPALLVCDHSPTLCLAAYGAVPTVVVGTGFSVPPAEGTTYPLLLPRCRPLVPEADLLAVVQEVQRRRGRPAPETLPALMGRAERFLTVLPEMDLYQGLRPDVPLGPVGALAPLAPRPAAPRYFAYLSAETPALEPILRGLAGSGCPGSAYVRGASPELRRRLEQPGLELVDGPQPAAEIMPGVSVVVHHAGMGLAQHALAAGRPQLVFPGHLEQILNGQMLHRLGVGQYLLGAPNPDTVAQELRQLIADRGIADQAAARAASLRERGPWDPLPRIVERCLVLLEQSYLFPHAEGSDS